MRNFICSVVAGITISACAYSPPLEHEWTATLKAVDETGQPVAGAKAGIGNSIAKLEMSGLTDTNGIFIASHHDAVENLAFYAEKSGYYPFQMTYHKGNYDPERWNPVQTIVLKRIIKPIPMYAKSVNLGVLVFDKPVGFDLELGNWVAPYGNGVNMDIIFTAHRETNIENDVNFKLTVSFPKAGDGIQAFDSPVYYLQSRGSALRSNEEAPTNGYQAEWIQYRNQRHGKPTESNRDMNRNYYFRVRTKVDDRGNVVSAHYGKIYGDFMHFAYYLNPTPNSRNVEFDPKQNLIHGLKFDEEVKAP